MRAAGSCGDQSGRTSAPIRPQAVHTILGHKDPHRHFVRQPIGIHDGAVVAPARGAVDEQIAAAVTAYVTERDGLKGLAAARGMRPHQFSPVFTSLWAAVEVNAVQTKYGFYWGAIADPRNEKHIPMSPKAGMFAFSPRCPTRLCIGSQARDQFAALARSRVFLVSARRAGNIYIALMTMS